MKKSAKKIPLIDNDIFLNDEQIELYTHDLLYLKRTDGSIVDIIQANGPVSVMQDRAEEAAAIISLLSTLLSNQHGGIELSETDALGFSNILTTAQKLLTSTQ